MVPKFLFLIFPMLAVLLGNPAPALELEVLSPEMTRQEADDYLTRDYTYRVLEDGSVRRTWSPDANSRLMLDFDPKKGTLLSMIMEYRKPIAEEEAMKMLRIMTCKEKISWAKIPEDKMSKIGVDGAKAVKVGKGVAFYEATAAGKCLRITVYPRPPKESRLLLREIAVSEAMQSSFTTSQAVTDCRKLMEEEEKIFFTPNKAELAKVAAAARKRKAEAGDEESTSIAVNTVQQDEPEPEVEDEPAAEAEAVTEVKPVASTEKKKKKKKAREKTFMEKMGLGNMSEGELMAYGGGVLVLLLIIIFAVRSKMNNDIRKSREKNIRLGTATSADQLGAPRRSPQPRRKK